jgi:hypothetical protein
LLLNHLFDAAATEFSPLIEFTMVWKNQSVDWNQTQTSSPGRNRLNQTQALGAGGAKANQSVGGSIPERKHRRRGPDKLRGQARDPLNLDRQACPGARASLASGWAGPISWHERHASERGSRVRAIVGGARGRRASALRR